jgi:hypothetical protein
MDTAEFVFVAFVVGPPLLATSVVFAVGWFVLWLADFIDDLEWL